MPASLVTPSTSVATSSPKSALTSSSEALVSSTVSCSSAAHSVAVSRRMLAQILATPTGWMMKSSPEARRWSLWWSQAKMKAFSHEIAVHRLGVAFAECSSTHGEEVAEQHAQAFAEPLSAAPPGRARGACSPSGLRSKTGLGHRGARGLAVPPLRDFFDAFGPRLPVAARRAGDLPPHFGTFGMV